MPAPGETPPPHESRAALVALALEEGKPAEAESLARAAATVCAGPKAPGNEAMADIEAKRSAAAGQQILSELRKAAKAKGFSFYAR